MKPLNSDILNQILAYIKANPETTIVPLVDCTNLTKTTVRNYCNQLEKIGKITHTTGRNNTFYYEIIQTETGKQPANSIPPAAINKAIETGSQLRQIHKEKTLDEFIDYLENHLLISYTKAKNHMKLAKYAPTIYQIVPENKRPLLPETPRAFRDFLQGYTRIRKQSLRKKWVAAYLNTAQQNHRPLKGTEIKKLWQQTSTKNNWHIPYARKNKGGN